jgi:hypothetical protein
MNSLINMDNLLAIEDKIKTLEKSYNSALDDLKKYYILNETYPENEEYKNFLNSIKAEMEHYSKSLVNISKDIISGLKSIEQNVIDKSNKLENQKNIYEKLSSMYTDLEQKQNGSSLFINDSKELYNHQYYRNLHLFIGISGLVGLLVYLAKKKQ